MILPTSPPVDHGIRRRALIAGLVGVLAAPRAVRAQTARQVPRVGYLSSQSPASEVARIDAFRLGLRDLGWVEGRNLAVEYRFAEGKLERLAAFAAELVQLKVEVIVTGGSPGTRAALGATRTIPLVMTVVGDPIEMGFVATLGRPGGNVTGLTQMSPQLAGKRLELLKEAFPRVVRVAMLVDAALRGVTLPEARSAADVLGVRLHVLPIRGPRPDLDGAFKTAASQGADALMVSPGPAVELYKARVIELVARSRLPAIYGTGEFVELGGLMSYGPDRIDLNRRAAAYVDKLLRGAKAAELPVEQPTKFELAISLRTARALGLSIPPSVLLRADQIVE